MKEWIYGRNSVYEVLRAGRRQTFRLSIAQGAEEKGRLADILHLANARKVPVERVPRNRLDGINPGHQGVILESSEYPYCSLPDILDLAELRGDPPWLLILDTLQDPQNLGTLLRTAEAVGVHGVVFPYRHTATVTPSVVNASSGASEHLLIAQANLAQAITTLKDAEVWVIGLDSNPQAKSLVEIDLKGPLALVVGNEGQGMRPLVAKSCDFLLRLPIQGKVESLNASVAGSIALYLTWMSRNNPKVIP